MDGHRALARTGAAGGMIVVGAANGALALLVGFPLFTAQALRYGLAAAVFAIVVGCRGLLRPLPTPRQLGRLALLAATGLFGFTTLSLVALAHGDPASVGAVVGCTPLLLAVLAPRSRGVRPSARMVSAACVVVVGATIVQGFGHFDGLGLLAALGVLCCEAAFSLLAVPLLPSLGALRVSLWETALATPMLLLAALVARAVAGVPLWAPLDWSRAAALGYLALVVTVAAFVCWYGAVHRIGAEQAGLFAGLMPIAAAISGVLLGTGAFRWAQLVGAALVGAGVVAGSGTPRRARPAGLALPAAGDDARDGAGEPVAARVART